jgi:hypothetical protein
MLAADAAGMAGVCAPAEVAAATPTMDTARNERHHAARRIELLRTRGLGD